MLTVSYADVFLLVNEYKQKSLGPKERSWTSI